MNAAAVRKSIKEQHLEDLESEFHSLLISCLEASVRGRWGLFGQNESPEGRKYLKWPEAERLRTIAHEIHLLRQEFGIPNAACERFLHYCSIRDANALGEPKLAKIFLDEIQKTS